jgi:hypothetical protein
MSTPLRVQVIESAQVIRHALAAEVMDCKPVGVVVQARLADYATSGATARTNYNDQSTLALKTGQMSATVSVTLQAARPYFAQGRYYAPAGQAFTLKITNSMFTLRDQKPLRATLLISPSHDPAIAPVPGRPGWSISSTERASFVAPPVTAPETGVFTVPPLAAGTYVMQLMEGGLESSTTLIVR